MTKTIHAILIDPVARTVESVELAAGLAAIYEALQCTTVAVVAIDADHSAYVDDEGLLSDPAPSHYWRLADERQLIAGRGLVVGTNDDGEDESARWSPRELERLVTFVEAEFLGLDQREGVVDWPVFGPTPALISAPSFRVIDAIGARAARVRAAGGE